MNRRTAISTLAATSVTALAGCTSSAPWSSSGSESSEEPVEPDSTNQSDQESDSESDSSSDTDSDPEQLAQTELPDEPVAGVDLQNLDEMLTEGGFDVFEKDTIRDPAPDFPPIDTDIDSWEESGSELSLLFKTEGTSEAQVEVESPRIEICFAESTVDPDELTETIDLVSVTILSENNPPYESDFTTGPVKEYIERDEGSEFLTGAHSVRRSNREEE